MNIRELFDFLPKFQEKFVQRYEILNFIKLRGKVGRRIIASSLSISERMIRDESLELKKLGLVEITGKGIAITPKGTEVLRNFFSLYRELNSLSELSKNIMEILNLKKVIVVSNGVEKDFSEIGFAAAHVIDHVIKEGDTLGVTGGRTMYAVAEATIPKQGMNLKVIPARGSIGTNANYQADRVASTMASRLDAMYYNYPIPDTLSPETIRVLLQTKEVQEIHHMLKDLDLLVFGMGRADVMARRRGLDEKMKEDLLQRGAVGEAFGHYFDIDGHGVDYQDSIGIHLHEFQKIPTVIGVAAGREKAKAVIAISALRQDMILIIDEEMAQEIIDLKVR